MVNMRGASLKVHRSLLQRELMAGVPQVGLVLIFVMSILFVYLFKLYFMIVPIVILYFIMRYLTSRDPWMIDVVIENIQQKDVFIP